MRSVSRFAAMFGAACLVPHLVEAQDVDPSVSIQLMPYHYAAVPCGILEEENVLTCEDIEGDFTEIGLYYVYVLVVREGGFPDGIGGFQFGIEYDDDASLMGWEHCAGGADIPQEGWPTSGTGNAMTWWGGCHVPPGDVAIAGDFVISGPPGAGGEIRIVPDPRTGRVEWVNCEFEAFEVCPENLGRFDLSLPVDPDCAPNCGAVPSRTVSWGAIKFTM